MYYGILSSLIWPIIIVVAIVYFIRRKRKKVHPSQNKDWYLQFALSKEDSVSQFFLLLSFFFLGVTLFAFNSDFGGPLTWRTILLITSFVGLVGAYYLKLIYTLVFSLIGLTSWWGAQAALWIDAKDIKTSAILAGLSFLALIFYSVGHLHEKEIRFKRFALVYTVLGIISITSTLFFFSTKPGVGLIGDMTKGLSIFGSWQLTLSLFVLLAVLIGTALSAAVRKLISPLELIAVFGLACLLCVTVLLPEQIMFEQGTRANSFQYGGRVLSSRGVLWALIYNAAIFFELLGLIFSGYFRRETWLINLGAVFLFLLIIVKYFDWFFTFLDKSIFFIGAGILLFVVGWLMERGRKYMISNIESETQST